MRPPCALDDHLADREAEAAALDRVRGGAAAAEEALEEPLLLGGRDADAGVGHLAATWPPDDATVTATVPPGGVNFSAFETRLSTTWPRRVRSPVTRAPARRRDLEGDAALDRGGPRGLARLGHHLAQVHLGRGQRELAGVGAGHVEQVVDQVAQPLAVAGDDAQEALLLGRELAGVALAQRLEVAQDRGERRAQLVRGGAR